MSEMSAPPQYQRIDQYHPDKHHFSNWCRKCGIYYCWHEEANNGIPLPTYKHHIIHHKFTPMVTENDFWDWDVLIFIPDWLFCENGVCDDYE